MVVKHQEELHGETCTTEHCIEFNVGAQVISYPSLLVSRHCSCVWLEG